MSAMMVLRSGVAAGAVLIAAGLYQLTPLKESCLDLPGSSPPIGAEGSQAPGAWDLTMASIAWAAASP
jgi:hypothetical protein